MYLQRASTSKNQKRLENNYPWQSNYYWCVIEPQWHVWKLPQLGWTNVLTKKRTRKQSTLRNFNQSICYQFFTSFNTIPSLLTCKKKCTYNGLKLWVKHRRNCNFIMTEITIFFQHSSDLINHTLSQVC